MQINLSYGETVDLSSIFGESLEPLCLEQVKNLKDLQPLTTKVTPDWLKQVGVSAPVKELGVVSKAYRLSSSGRLLKINYKKKSQEIAQDLVQLLSNFIDPTPNNSEISILETKPEPLDMGRGQAFSSLEYDLTKGHLVFIDSNNWVAYLELVDFEIESKPVPTPWELDSLYLYTWPMVIWYHGEIGRSPLNLEKSLDVTFNEALKHIEKLKVQASSEGSLLAMPTTSLIQWLSHSIQSAYLPGFQVLPEITHEELNQRSLFCLLSSSPNLIKNYSPQELGFRVVKPGLHYRSHSWL